MGHANKHHTTLNLSDIIIQNKINITTDQLQMKFSSVWQGIHVKSNCEI